MKKLLILLLTLLVSITFAFANGGSEEKAAGDGPVDIELWYGAAVTEAGGIPDDWVGYDIIREKLNINLKLVLLPSDEKDKDVKVQAAGAANNLPDIFYTSRDTLAHLVKQGLVAPVDDMYAKMPSRTATYYDEAAIKHATFDGHSYGFAQEGDMAGIEGLVVRKDWLDNLGLEVPTNLDELYDVLYAFTYNDPDGNGRNDTWGYGAYVETNKFLKGYPGSRLWPIMGAYGVAGLWQFDEENLGLAIYKPEFYDMMVFLRKLCTDGVIDPNWLSYKKDDFRAAWKQGRFGVMYEQYAALSAKSNYAPFDNNFPEGEWIVIDPPVGPNGEQSVGAVDQGYRIYAVSQKAINQGKEDAICSLFEWLGTDEAYKLLGWGVEGVNYVLDENGYPSVGDLGENSFQGTKGQVVTQLRNMVFHNTEAELASRFPVYTCDNSGKQIAPLEYLFAMNSKPWTVATGSASMPTPNADIFRYYEQSLAEFLTGAKELTPANWQNFLNGFERVGGKGWNEEGIEYARENNLVLK